MTVAQLKKAIENLPDTAHVVVSAPDHSYRTATAEATTALYDRRSGWTEDHGEDVTPESEYGKRLQVLFVG